MNSEIAVFAFMASVYAEYLNTLYTCDAFKNVTAQIDATFHDTWENEEHGELSIKRNSRFSGNT